MNDFSILTEPYIQYAYISRAGEYVYLFMLVNPRERMIVTNQGYTESNRKYIEIPHASVLLIKLLFPEINFARVQIGKYEQKMKLMRRNQRMRLMKS